VEDIPSRRWASGALRAISIAGAGARGSTNDQGPFFMRFAEKYCSLVYWIQQFQEDQLLGSEIESGAFGGNAS
jgi:hypothetical protein